jgi:hypothetical protein
VEKSSRLLRLSGFLLALFSLTSWFMACPNPVQAQCPSNFCIDSGDGNDPGLAVITTPYSGWGAPCGASKWIADTPAGMPPLAGFTDTRTITIPTGTDIALSTFTLNVQADDSVAVSVNGVAAEGCTYLECYMACKFITLPPAMFAIGTNTITMNTPNGDGGPGGLDFELCASLACAPGSTPTPTPTSTPTTGPTATPTITPTPPPALPDVFYIDHNVFSPANGSLIVQVDCAVFPGNYSLKIYNTAGEFIQDLSKAANNPPYLNTQLPPQTYYWDGTNYAGNKCASGVYFFHLVEPTGDKTKRVILVR